MCECVCFVYYCVFESKRGGFILHIAFFLLFFVQQLSLVFTLCGGVAVPSPQLSCWNEYMYIKYDQRFSDGI